MVERPVKRDNLSAAIGYNPDDDVAILTLQWVG
jgi:hypothetical protein